MEDLIQPWFPEMTETRAILLSRSLGRLILLCILSLVRFEIHPGHCHQLRKTASLSLSWPQHMPRAAAHSHHIWLSGESSGPWAWGTEW